MVSALSRHPRTAWRVLGGKAVVVSVDQGRMYTLSASATKIWEALATPRTLEELARVLMDAYGIDEARAREDCERFLEDLQAKGLVVVENAPQPDATVRE